MVDNMSFRFIVIGNIFLFSFIVYRLSFIVYLSITAFFTDD